jgi:hypothetical protein
VLSWASLDADRPGLFAMTSLDAGRSWGEVEAIHTPPADQATLFAPLAYDPVADRLVAIWTCCADARWDVVPSTHYARWSVPDSGVWLPAASNDPPLALGSRVAAQTVAAQPANSRRTWLAWVEQQQRIEVRSLALNQLIPVDQYPAATPGGAP